MANTICYYPVPDSDIGHVCVLGKIIYTGKSPITVAKRMARITDANAAWCIVRAKPTKAFELRGVH